IFIAHGWSKVKNPAGIAQSVWRGYKPAGLVHGLFEVTGGAALVANFWIGRSCVALALIMLGALYYKIVKWKVPFVGRDSTGWELDLLVLAGLLALLLG